MQVAAVDLYAPPLETPKEGAGAPPGGYLDPHIKLKQKTRRTEAVDEALYRRGHARTAFGTVADINIIPQTGLSCRGSGGELGQ